MLVLVGVSREEHWEEVLGCSRLEMVQIQENTHLVLGVITGRVGGNKMGLK